MVFHKYFTWRTKSEPQNLTRNPYGRQVWCLLADNRKEWESEVHINLVATSSILRFEDCLHSSFGLLRADRCSTNELCLLKSDDFHFQRGIRGPSVTLTECQMTGGHKHRKYDAWAWRFRRSWRSGSVKESGNGEWRETIHILLRSRGYVLWLWIFPSSVRPSF